MPIGDMQAMAHQYRQEAAQYVEAHLYESDDGSTTFALSIDVLAEEPGYQHLFTGLSPGPPTHQAYIARLRLNPQAHGQEALWGDHICLAALAHKHSQLIEVYSHAAGATAAAAPLLAAAGGWSKIGIAGRGAPSTAVPIRLLHDSAGGRHSEHYMPLIPCTQHPSTGGQPAAALAPAPRSRTAVGSGHPPPTMNLPIRGTSTLQDGSPTAGPTPRPGEARGEHHTPLLVPCAGHSAGAPVAGTPTVNPTRPDRGTCADATAHACKQAPAGTRLRGPHGLRLKRPAAAAKPRAPKPRAASTSVPNPQQNQSPAPPPAEPEAEAITMPRAAPRPAPAARHQPSKRMGGGGSLAAMAASLASWLAGPPVTATSPAGGMPTPLPEEGGAAPAGLQHPCPGAPREPGMAEKAPLPRNPQRRRRHPCASAPTPPHATKRRPQARPGHRPAGLGQALATHSNNSGCLPGTSWASLQ